MRSIKQPGAPVADRIQWVEARGRAFTFTMERGLPLLEAAHRGFAAQGFAGGVLDISAGALGPFAYVMPALSKTPDHAAFYSETHRPSGVTQLSTATMTLGVRDGAPFFHCHALWMEEGGRNGGGHILPEETVVAEPFEVEAFGLDGAIFAAEPDPETGFKLFGPVAAAPLAATTDRCAFALRLRPNQDFAACLEAFCQAQGIREARIRGGVGSTIGARFASRARCRAGRLYRRIGAGQAGPRRQPGAHDHGAGAGGPRVARRGHWPRPPPCARWPVVSPHS